MVLSSFSFGNWPFYFKDNGCQDHYEPAGDLCIRASIYPETYENAQLKCVSEGGFLLPITSEEVQVTTLCLLQSQIINKI